MKKFTLCFIVLLIFSVFVFWQGFTQRKIKADTFGVLQSKTSGLCEKPLMAGEYNWNWEFLLPTNADLKLFSIKPFMGTKKVTGQLPSGQLYTSLYNTNYDFSYSFDFSISLTISPEGVINLIKLNQIVDENDLEKYFENSADLIAQKAANYLLSKAEDNPKFRAESLKKDELIRNIQLYNDIPEIELFMISVNNSQIPDYTLYNKLQNNYIFSQNNNEQEVENVEKTDIN